MKGVAVVIPAYNAASTIAETLESVLAQHLPAQVVVVVDDGSQDDTAFIVARLAARHDRIRLIVQQHAGPAAARNRAIAATQAEFIAPIDSDDLWDPAYLDRMLAALMRESRSGFAYCRHRLIDATGAVIREGMPFDLAGGCFGPMLLVNPVGNGSSAVFRRSAILGAGGYAPPGEEWFGGEDYFLQLRIAARNPVTCLPETLSSYRMSQTSLSRNERAARRARLQAISRAIEEFGPCPLPVLRWVRADAARVEAVAALGRGRLGEALACSLSAAAADPAGTTADLLRRLANATRRMGRAGQQVAPRIDPLADRRARRLGLVLPYAAGTREADPAIPRSFRSLDGENIAPDRAVPAARSAPG